MDSKTLDELFENLSKKYIAVGEKSQNATVDEIIDNIVTYYENIINPMPAHIYWLDTSMRVVGCNQNVLNSTGFKTLAELKGLSYEELAKHGHWPDHVKEAFKEGSDEVMRTGNPKLNIEEPPVPDGTGRMLYFLTSRVPIFDKQKKIVGVLGISVDITERKRAEEEIRIAKEKAEVASYTKSEFIANINHDIRTPLASMIGMSEIIIEESQEQHVREYAQDIIKAGERLLEFVNNILDIMQTDMTAIQQQPVDLRQIMQSLEELYKPSFSKKKLQFLLDYDDSIPRILGGSSNLIYRMVLNLIGNAIKFTDEGSVSVEIKQTKIEGEKRFIMISVTDTGIGIPEDKQQVIFESFTKLSPSYQGIYKGNGLGLYTVKQLAEKLQGTVEVKSSVGKGSTFIITLPLIYNEKFAQMLLTTPVTENRHFDFASATEFLKVKHQDENRLVSGMGHGESRVLVVEDDEIAGKVAVLRLQRLGCQVDLAVTGEEALRKAKETSYRLIYMDIGLPDKDGRIVTEEIRAWEKQMERPAAPIIALTAHVDDAGKEKCLAAGINVVVKKPISQALMQQHIEQYLSRRPLNGTQPTESDEAQEEITALFRQEIKGSLSTIQQYYQKKNWEALQFVIHKCNGSASYCAPRSLKISISELENALLSAQRQANLVETSFKKFVAEANTFLDKKAATAHDEEAVT